MKISPFLVLRVRLVPLKGCPPLLLAVCAILATTQHSVGREKQIKGVPQPERWAAFVKSAGEGKIEQVSDQPYPVPLLRGEELDQVVRQRFAGDRRVGAVKRQPILQLADDQHPRLGQPPGRRAGAHRPAARRQPLELRVRLRAGLGPARAA